jgi:hypothetical protein
MPEQRMSAQLTRLAKKRGRLPALVTALAFGVLVALQQFLSNGVSYLRLLSYPAPDSGPVSDLFDLRVDQFEFHPTVDQLLFFVLPLTLGVFLCLWVVAPISDELTVRFVLTRAALASAGAALLVIVFQAVQGLFESIGASSTSYPWSLGIPHETEGVNFEVFGQNTLDAVASGVSTFIFHTPVVMLAGVLLWLWLREHPREYAVAGLIDEL